MADTLYIIDGHSHIYASFYAPMKQQLTSPTGEPTKASYIFTTMLMGLIQRQKPDMLVVAMDSRARTFRKEIYADYKAHRAAMPEELPAQIKQIERILQAMNIPMLRVDGYEADDIIGTVADKAAKRGCQVYICSSDKDILQLLNHNIRVFDVRKGQIIDAQAMREKIGVEPEQYIDCLALEGDASDNVPGVPDVGPKTGRQWIRDYGSLDNLLAHADEIKGKRGNSLREHKEDALLSRRLVTIRKDVPIDVDCELFRKKDFALERLQGVFAELGFNKLLGQLEHKQAPSAQTVDQAAAQLAPEAVQRRSAADYRLVDSPEKLAQLARKLKDAEQFAIDVQASSPMPIWAQLIGISFSIEPETGYYLPVRASLGARSVDINLVRESLGPVIADGRIAKRCHDVKYNKLVLAGAGMELNGVTFDTMIASYCLDSERPSHSVAALAQKMLGYDCMDIVELLGRGKDKLTFEMVDPEAACMYAAEAADIIGVLGDHLSSQLHSRPDIYRLYEQLELPLADVLAQMELNGVSLDIGLLRNMSGRLHAELDKLTEQIYELAGGPFNIGSPKQLGEVLFDKLSLQGGKTGKKARSTDVNVLENLRGSHEIIDLVLQYRQLSKLANTYVDKLGALINPRTNRLHCTFNQCVTATGRLSSSAPNLQNIPIRTEIGRKIRGAFVPAQEQNRILSADYSQVELRLLAHFSGDRALREAFAQDKDIHSFVASQIYNVALEQVTPEMRSRCKAVNFGIIYGQSAHGLSKSIGLSRAEAQDFIDAYFARYGSIGQFMDQIIAQAGRDGFVRTILNRRRRIAHLASKNANKRSQAQRLAVNTVIQGSAADLIKVAMINIHRKIQSENLPVKMLLQVHDELVFELPADQQSLHTGWITEQMTQALELDVPLKVDISCGQSWLK